MPTSLRQRAGLLQICLAGVLWGTGGLAVQVIRDHADLSPTTISAYRWVGVTVSTVVSLGVAPLAITVRDAVRRRRGPDVVETLTVFAALAGLVLVSGTSGLGETGLVPLALLAGGPWTTSDPVALVTLVYLGALTFALAYALLYAGLRTTSSGAAVVATLCEPVTAAVAAAAFLGERLTGGGVLGIGLVVAAIAGSAREKHPVGAGPVADPDPGRETVDGIRDGR